MDINDFHPLVSFLIVGSKVIIGDTRQFDGTFHDLLINL